MKGVQKRKEHQKPQFFPSSDSSKGTQQRIRSEIKTPRASARPYKSLIGNLHKGFFSLQLVYTLIS